MDENTLKCKMRRISQFLKVISDNILCHPKVNVEYLMITKNLMINLCHVCKAMHF